MEESEYHERLKKIESDFEQAKKQLYIDYAMSKAIFKKGDIIKCDQFTILIEKITEHKSYGLPMPVYTGPELKKDLTPRKDGSRGSKYGNDNATLIQSA